MRCRTEKSKHRVGFSLLLILSFILMMNAGCASKLWKPRNEDMLKLEKTYPEANLVKLQEGREIFVKQCSSCHHLPLPYRHEKSHWPKILEIMGKRAKLTNEERELVLTYLVTANSVHSLD